MPAYKGKALAQLQQKVLDVFGKLPFDLYFSPGHIRAQKVKQVGVLKDLIGQVGIHGRESLWKIVDALPGSLHQSTLNL